MAGLKYFAAAFTLAVMTVSGMRSPLYAAQQNQTEFIQADMQQDTDTYEVFCAEQLIAALNGTCADSSYRTMYDRGRIHITMKNVSLPDGMESYMLSSSIIVAGGKQFVLDMNGLDLYASGRSEQGAVSNPAILVPPSSSLTVQSGWIESSIRNISINNQGYLKLDGIHVIPAVGQAVYNMGISDLAGCCLYAGENTAYAVINEGGTLTLDSGERAGLSELTGIYNVRNGRGDACLYIRNGFHITDIQGHAVVNNGGLVRIGELAEKNSSVINGSQTGVLTVNGGSTEMYDGVVQGGMAAVSTSPNAFASVSAGKTNGSFTMIGGTLSGNYGVAFQADAYVYLKAGTVTGEQAAVASVAYDGTLTDNIASYQFYNTNSEEADAYYYDSSAKTNILCTEIRGGKIVLSPEETGMEETVEPLTDDREDSALPEEMPKEISEVTVGGQDVYWNEEYGNLAAQEDMAAEESALLFPAPTSVPEEPERLPETSSYYNSGNGDRQEGQGRLPDSVYSGSGIRDGTLMPGGSGIRDGTSAFHKRSIRDGTG